MLVRCCCLLLYCQLSTGQRWMQRLLLPLQQPQHADQVPLPLLLLQVP
jgi:hypothetical protein